MKTAGQGLPLMPVRCTEESRFTVSTCDKCERVWRCHNIRHNQFDAASVIVWRGLLFLYVIYGTGEMR